MPDNKTNPTQVTVDCDSVSHACNPEDAKLLGTLFRKVTGERPVMLVPSYKSDGSNHYKSGSGLDGDRFYTGVYPRKSRHSLYPLGGHCDVITGAKYEDLPSKLGKYSLGNSCLRNNKRADVEMAMLKEPLRSNWDAINGMYPPT